MSLYIALLYNITFCLLLGLALFVLFKNPRSPVNRYFSLTAAALLAWLATLYVFGKTSDGGSLDLIGRLNFVAILWAVQFAYFFMRELTEQPVRVVWTYFAEAGILTLVTIFTTLVDAHEWVIEGVHVTSTGPLFVLFALHITAYPVATLVTANRARASALPRLRSQLEVIMLGIGTTTGIALLTGIVLPYAFGNFQYEEIGALSVILAIGFMAYAIVVRHLFDVRVVLRKTLVIAILITLIEKIYANGIELISDVLPGADSSPAFQKGMSLATVLFIALSFEPVKQWLERQLNRGPLRGNAIRRSRQSR